MRSLALLIPIAALALACDSTGTTAEASTASGPPVVIGGEIIDRIVAQVEEPESTSQPTSDHEESGDRRPGPLAPGESGHYGAPFTIEGEAMALSAALESCPGSGEPCLVAGTVDRVCQVSGCWFTVAAPDVEATVRIRMQDYGFFVPRNTVGASVTFQGLLELEEIPQEEAQHYADDEAAAGGERRVVDGPELTYEFMITGAEVSMPGS